MGESTWIRLRVRPLPPSCRRPSRRCACRKFHPCMSGGMLVLVEDAAEALVSSYVQTGDLVRIGDRRGQWMQRGGVRDALMRPVAVIEILELAQDVEQMVLVPDQRPIQQLAPAGLHPPFDDR